MDEVGKWLLGHRRVRDGMAAKPRLGAILTREASSLRPRGPVSAKAAGQGAGVVSPEQSFGERQEGGSARPEERGLATLQVPAR